MTLQQKPTFESTLKSTDTEEFIDIHFYRPLGYRWALIFDKYGVSPNQVTILSVFIGIAAGICFYYTNLFANLLGVFLLIWANTYDSADGQLARMTNQKTELGRILDGVGGYLWFITIYTAIVLRIFPHWGWGIIAIALFSSCSHGVQTVMADYFRNLHLFFLKGKEGSELDNSSKLKEKYKLIPWRKPLEKIFQKMYILYTEGQEILTPNLQKMLRIINVRYAGIVPEEFSKAFCKKSFPLLKYTNMLSFNLRSIVLFVCMLSYFPLGYLLFELTVMNLLLVYLVRKYEGICKKITVQLRLN